MTDLEVKMNQVYNLVEERELQSWYGRFINSITSKDEEYIEVGEVLPFDNPTFIVHVMREWVERQDSYIAKLNKQTKDAFTVALAFSQRGVTLEEFKYVMSKSRPQNYKNHPAFFYFHIINEESHDYFVATNNDPEKDLTTLYIERVQSFVLTEIPTLKEFFFTYFKKYFPFSALQRHAYVLGGTGSGKSEVLKYLYYCLWNRSKEKRSYSLISIEPHGKLSYELLQFNLLAEDPKRVVYLDPFLRETARRLCGEDVLGEDYTFVFNPFDLPRKTPTDVNYATQELSYALFEILESEASRQMKAVVRACVSTLLNGDGFSISDLKRFMDDDENADLIQAGLKNPNNEHRKTIARMHDSSLSPTKSGIYYRLASLIDDIHLRRVLMGNSTIDIEAEMNSGKVVICNMAKGHMGQESAPMLGKLLVALIQGYATKRDGNKHIKPTFLFIDEMQNYVTPSVKKIMTESRKYGLHLVLANQVLGQDMTTKMLDIILSNTSIKLAGDNDPKSLKGMGETMGLKLKDFDTLKKYHFFSFNKMNKKAGAVMMKVPSNLVKVAPPYFVSKDVLRDYFKWLALDSGYYIKTPVEELQSVNLKAKNKGKGKSKADTPDEAQPKQTYDNPFKD